MKLESTPHIRIRKANGLNYIDYTQCDILTLNKDSSTAAARSYNTIIGIYTKDETGKKIYLETAGVYSTTTATKHKPRARSIAIYNGFTVIPDIKPEILHELFFNNKYNIQEILQEAATRAKLLQDLQQGITTNFLINNLKKAGIIKARRKPESHQYKNGNHQTKYYYITNFKYVHNITYEVNQKHTRETIPAYAGPKGPKPARTTYSITNTPVNIQD